MSYRIGFDGVVTAELEKLLQSVENHVNGLSMHVQASDTGASTVEGGTRPPHDFPCPNGVKIGHDCVHYTVVVGLLAVGAVIGFAAAKLGAGGRQ
jgi:hypothetical protein